MCLIFWLQFGKSYIVQEYNHDSKMNNRDLLYSLCWHAGWLNNTKASLPTSKSRSIFNLERPIRIIHQWIIIKAMFLFQTIAQYLKIDMQKLHLIFLIRIPKGHHNRLIGNANSGI